MGLEINRKKKSIRVGSTLSLILGIIAFFLAIFADSWGWASLLILPLYILGLFGSVMGVVPFIGPILYWFGVRSLFSMIIGGCGLQVGIGSNIILYTNFIFSIMYCFITTSLTLIWLASKMKKLKNLGKKDHNETT